MSTDCRNCGHRDLEVMLDLGELPLANALLTEEQLDKPEPRYPLELAFCSGCSLVQITHTVPPSELFEEYAYFSSFSTTMVEHARKLVEELIPSRSLGPNSLAVEVASNDGYLLQHYVAAGIPVLGIDPAKNLAESAEGRGVPTITEFFGNELAKTLRSRNQGADVIHANNVLAHVPQLHDFVSGLKTLLAADGIAVIETPYIRDLVEKLEFDTIYHEHLFYYSLTALESIFGRNGLLILDVERVPIHGGSLRVTVGSAKGQSQSPAVAAMLAEEKESGLDTADYYRDFSRQVEGLRKELLDLLQELTSGGQRIAAYGAAAKGATLLNSFGIGSETIEFVADRNTYKQGRYMPGVRIPIVPPEELMKRKPDAVLLLVWNFAEEVLAQQGTYRDAGGKFIIPIPTPEVV